MDPIAPLIDSLHGEGRLRVWSLVITAFGDLVQHRGGQISSARLGRLLGRVGVEPGAMRTALSRLGRDGWVESRRQGRSSLYRLSRQGLARFAPATSRIYAPPRDGPVRKWAVSVRFDANGAERVSLVPAEDAPAEPDLCVTGALERVSPAWRAAMLDTQHRAALAALARDLHALPPDPADPLDAAALRLLLIHRWRRIVLRFPDIAPELMPGDAPMADPRAEVARAYIRLIASAETWLDSSTEGLSSMPPADAGFAERFRRAKGEGA
ncbi:MAG TPA: hypothetical protein DEA05_03410 [Rhodobacteraceae bacterium]|jgi:phenylacetic acid degradation operon negative regulatory protein|nr:hypothetical protein [Paracoccaceae bacterium]